jgi:fibronectin-binding autotransporter adhesin
MKNVARLARNTAFAESPISSIWGRMRQPLWRYRHLFALSGLSLVTPDLVYAADECGAIGSAPSYVVQCTNTALNPYAGGINYAPAAGLDLRLGTGIIVNLTAGPGNTGVEVFSSTVSPVSVTLDNGAEINATGKDVGGIAVQTTGDISIVSGGLIAVVDPTAPLADSIGPYGILGQVFAGAGTGNISLRLLQTGIVRTNGEYGEGVYALNDGLGNAMMTIEGKITTLGFASDGAFAWINNAASAAAASVDLSSTAQVATQGDSSIGAWASTEGVGPASIRSAGSVSTMGVSAFGLNANVDNAGNTSDIRVDLLRGGNVVTAGNGAIGIRVRHDGAGDAIATLEGGTSVSTSGRTAHGVNVIGNEAAIVLQAAGSIVRTTGLESNGMQLRGALSISADIDGAVSSSGQFASAVSAVSSAGDSNVTVGPDAVVGGGWQTGATGVGALLGRPAAGVIIGSATGSTLANAGSIGALSDRAIVDDGVFTAATGNLSILNGGRIAGFLTLDGGGSNTLVNASGGLFDIRHFADTDGDGQRDANRVAISDFGAAPSSLVNQSGATVRLAAVSGATTVDGAGYYIPTAGWNSRPLESAYYTLARPGVVQGQLVNLGTFSNAGTLDLRGSATGNTLVMTSNAAAGGAAGSGVFVSNGGQLLINTMFNSGLAVDGDSGSYSDVLVVDGTLLGTAPTSIKIDRRDGRAAATPGDGILVVEVRNKAASAAGAFSLAGDYVRNDQPLAIAGSRAYGLYLNGVGADSADGNWYLRDVAIAPTVPVYEAYSAALEALIDMPTLRQRKGEVTVFSTPGNEVRNRPVGTGYQVADGSLWLRVKGGLARKQLSQSTGSADYDSRVAVMQLGVDRLLSETERGVLEGGVTLQYTTADTQISANNGEGKIQASGYGFGGTLTWYSATGFYTDLQAQVVRTDADITSATAQKLLVAGNRGLGYALSVEAGMPHDIAPHWSATPQAQLIYSNISFDRFTDPFGAKVSSDSGDSMLLRIGMDFARRQERRAGENAPNGLTFHGGVNLYRMLSSSNSINISDGEFATGAERTMAGLDLGISYQYRNGVIAFAEMSGKAGLKRPMDDYSLTGRVGVRVQW